MSFPSSPATIRVIAGLLFGVYLVQPALCQSSRAMTQSQLPKQQSPQATIPQVMRDLTSRAEAGDARAQLRLANLFATGNGIPQSASQTERTSAPHRAASMTRAASDVTLSTAFDRAQRFSEGLAAVHANERWGYIDRTGKLVIQPPFVQALEFKQGLAPVCLTTGGWGYIDSRGSVVISARFARADTFAGGLAAVEVAGKWGYVDRKGNLVVEPQFDDRRHFSEGLAAIKRGTEWGYIDASGKPVSEPRFAWADSFSQGLAGVRVQRGGDLGFIARDGSFAIEPSLSDMLHESWFSEGLAVVAKSREGPPVYVDPSGKYVLQPKSNLAAHFAEGRAVVGSPSGIGSFCGYTDVQVRVKPAGNLKNAEVEFPSDPAAYVFGGSSCKLGFIDTTGAVVTSDAYDGARSFSEGLAAVKKGEKWGYIDKAGALVIAPQFDEALSYSDGFAAVKSQGKWGYIDKKGRALRIGSK